MPRNSISQRKARNIFFNSLFLLILISLLGSSFLFAQSPGKSPLAPEDILKTKNVGSVQISPDGKWIAYTVNVPRKPADKPGPAYSELYLVSPKTGEIRPFITGKVNISSPQWSPDGKFIAFLTRRGEKAKTQVWLLPVDGGEARPITHCRSGVLYFRWHPSGKQIAFIATTPLTKREKKLKELGYGFIFFEENLKPRNLFLQDVPEVGGKVKPRQLTSEVTVWDFEFSPDGRTIAASISPRNLIDQRYVFRKIYLLDVASGKREQLTDNPGKLGNYAFSPDGKKLAYAAALTRSDNAVSQAFAIDLQTREVKNLTPPDFRGHVEWVGWKNASTLLYFAGEGVWNTLNLVKIKGGKRQIILHSQKSGVIFAPPSYTRDFKHFALRGDSPTHAREVFYWQPGKALKRLTNLNPWLKDRTFGRQEVVHYPSRDGVEIEGILVYPVDFQAGVKYPLIVVVHGGPESHYSNGWLNRYFHPAQVLAGKGYLVFYPNYRSSTGYGVKFAATGYGDPAGKEFDDVADGIEYLIKEGLADPERVGLGGGSYGGYAAAWFSSYYTKYVRAVCMFVGISDLISKRGTTDIPYEELFVHSGKPLEEMWDLSLKRSPIYYARQSKTAVLILGGTADTRVHPGQSLEYYRRLKMNNHPAVRLVQYPGEGHGNRRQPGRIDVLYRHLQWYDWYVKDKKPLDGPMPPLDISDRYGLELD